MALDIAQVAELSRHVIEEVEEAVVGKRAGLQNVMAGILSSGSHILLEDYPGLAKTLIANSFSTALGLSFKRIQSRTGALATSASLRDGTARASEPETATPPFR